MICRATTKNDVPKFNREIFLENNTSVGQVDEIFGPVNSYVKLF